jgi:hypothetical protein
MLNKNLVHIKDDKWIDPSKVMIIEPLHDGVQVGGWGCFMFFPDITVEEFIKLASKEDKKE